MNRFLPIALVFGIVGCSAEVSADRTEQSSAAPQCYKVINRKGDVVEAASFWTTKKDGSNRVFGKVNDASTDIASDKIRSIVFSKVVSTCAEGQITLLDNSKASFMTCNTIKFNSKFGESSLSPTDIASIAPCK